MLFAYAHLFGVASRVKLKYGASLKAFKFSSSIRLSFTAEGR